MSLTANRDYKKVTGQLEDDFIRINETFEKIDADVHELHEKVNRDTREAKDELRAEQQESMAMLGNLSLYALERTQKIKIGVEI